MCTQASWLPVVSQRASVPTAPYVPGCATSTAMLVPVVARPVSPDGHCLRSHYARAASPLAAGAVGASYSRRSLSPAQPAKLAARHTPGMFHEDTQGSLTSHSSFNSAVAAQAPAAESAKATPQASPRLTKRTILLGHPAGAAAPGAGQGSRVVVPAVDSLGSRRSVSPSARNPELALATVPLQLCSSASQLQGARSAEAVPAARFSGFQRTEQFGPEPTGGGTDNGEVVELRRLLAASLAAQEQQRQMQEQQLQMQSEHIREMSECMAEVRAAHLEMVTMAREMTKLRRTPEARPDPGETGLAPTPPCGPACMVAGGSEACAWEAVLRSPAASAASAVTASPLGCAASPANTATPRSVPRGGRTPLSQHSGILVPTLDDGRGQRLVWCPQSASTQAQETLQQLQLVPPLPRSADQA